MVQSPHEDPYESATRTYAWSFDHGSCEIKVQGAKSSLGTLRANYLSHSQTCCFGIIGRSSSNFLASTVGIARLRFRVPN